MIKDSEISKEKKLVKVLLNAANHVYKETIILSQFEEIQENKIPYLWPQDDNDDSFNKLINKTIEHLGGPPEFYLMRKDDNRAPPLADRYPETVMQEAFAVFLLARKSVLRAHVFMGGSSLLTANSEMRSHSEVPKELTVYIVKQAEATFWEHAETAYIRLCSFWDRIGQILDFAFFNIRKFDQNGFTSVMDRIHINAVPMNDLFKRNNSWKRLRAFQVSEKEDGLKWLLQRRNLLIHSLHLHPIQTDEDDVFKSQFNHLDVAHREKLRPREPHEEVTLLVEQIKKANQLFNDFITVINFSSSRKKDLFLRDQI
jgi:Cthe_2314-like HEPN